ncbi:MAG: hypothetical protein H7Y88_11225 [Phycisphaerales bacterium]|nr:hypothetical protein [Phycisphaerales bacterium]
MRMLFRRPVRHPRLQTLGDEHRRYLLRYIAKRRDPVRDIVPSILALSVWWGFVAGVGSCYELEDLPAFLTGSRVGSIAVIVAHYLLGTLAAVVTYRFSLRIIVNNRVSSLDAMYPCPNCGYDLEKSLLGGAVACPECGNEPRVFTVVTSVGVSVYRW